MTKDKVVCKKCNGSGYALPFGGSGIECKVCKGLGKINIVVKDDRTVFEHQEEAWLDNDCQGNREDYGQDD